MMNTKMKTTIAREGTAMSQEVKFENLTSGPLNKDWNNFFLTTLPRFFSCYTNLGAGNYPLGDPKLGLCSPQIAKCRLSVETAAQGADLCGASTHAAGFTYGSRKTPAPLLHFTTPFCGWD